MCSFNSFLDFWFFVCVTADPMRFVAEDAVAAELDLNSIYWINFLGVATSLFANLVIYSCFLCIRDALTYFHFTMAPFVSVYGSADLTGAS